MLRQLWIRFANDDCKVTYNPDDCLDLTDLKGAIKSTLSNNLGNVDPCDISLHLTKDDPSLDPTDSLTEVEKKNSGKTPLIVKVKTAVVSSTSDQQSRKWHAPIPERCAHSTGKLPIGIDGFRSVVEGDYTFVDKSLLIAEFLENHAHVLLILRPRRFGKSLNLSMLRYFFEKLEKDRPGSSGALSRRQLFRHLKIEERPDLFDCHFQKYPVIYFSLKDIKSANWTDMLSKTRDMIANIFSSHAYIEGSLTDIEKMHFNSIARTNPNYPHLTTSLQKLSRYLTRFHKAKCVILVDEYDAPLDSAYNNGFYDEAKDFFAGLFSSLLKGNDDNLYKAMLVGVLRVAKSGFLSGLNNLTVSPMYLPQFADKFGFTAKEVSILLKQYELCEISEDICKWYSGYCTGSNILVYNPWSIINVCGAKEIRPFWTESGGTTTIKKLIWNSAYAFKDNVSQLLTGHPLHVDLQDDIGYDSLYQGKSVNLWSLLYYAGYVTIDSKSCLRIPNLEVKGQWTGWFLSCLYDDTPRVATVLDHLLAGSVEKFAKTFPMIVMATLSYFDVGGTCSSDKAENFYHAFTLGLLVAAWERGFEVTSNRESGVGRYDVIIKPQHLDNTLGVILEFKVLHGKETLDIAATSGLDQIETQKYRSGMPEQVVKVLEVSIAFQGKIAMVKGRVLEKRNGNWKVV